MRVLPSILGAIAVGLLGLQTSAFAWNRCNNSLKSPALFPPPTSLLIWEKANSIIPGLYPHILGQGHLGVSFLKSRSRNRMFVEKSNLKLPELLKADAALLKLLKIIEKSGQDIGFRTIEVLDDSEENKLMLEYSEGATLHELMLSSRVSKELKFEMGEVYLENLKNLFLTLSSYIHEGTVFLDIPTPDFFMDEKWDALPSLYGKNSAEKPVFIKEALPKELSENDLAAIATSSLGGIHIKSDNIIVSPFRDKNGKVVMTIIDPY